MDRLIDDNDNTHSYTALVSTNIKQINKRHYLIQMLNIHLVKV